MRSLKVFFDDFPLDSDFGFISGLTEICPILVSWIMSTWFNFYCNWFWVSRCQWRLKVSNDGVLFFNPDNHWPRSMRSMFGIRPGVANIALWASFYLGAIHTPKAQSRRKRRKAEHFFRYIAIIFQMKNKKRVGHDYMLTLCFAVIFLNRFFNQNKQFI